MDWSRVCRAGLLAISVWISGNVWAQNRYEGMGLETVTLQTPLSPLGVAVRAAALEDWGKRFRNGSVEAPSAPQGLSDPVKDVILKILKNQKDAPETARAQTPCRVKKTLYDPLQVVLELQRAALGRVEDPNAGRLMTAPWSHVLGFEADTLKLNQRLSAWVKDLDQSGAFRGDSKEALKVRQGLGLDVVRWEQDNPIVNKWVEGHRVYNYLGSDGPLRCFHAAQLIHMDITELSYFHYVLRALETADPFENIAVVQTDFFGNLNSVRRLGRYLEGKESLFGIRFLPETTRYIVSAEEWNFMKALATFSSTVRQRIKRFSFDFTELQKHPHTGGWLTPKSRLFVQQLGSLLPQAKEFSVIQSQAGLSKDVASLVKELVAQLKIQKLMLVSPGLKEILPLLPELPLSHLAVQGYVGKGASRLRGPIWDICANNNIESMMDPIPLQEVVRVSRLAQKVWVRAAPLTGAPYDYGPLWKEWARKGLSSNLSEIRFSYCGGPQPRSWAVAEFPQKLFPNLRLISSKDCPYVKVPISPGKAEDLVRQDPVTFVDRLRSMMPQM